MRGHAELCVTIGKVDCCSEKGSSTRNLLQEQRAALELALEG